MLKISVYVAILLAASGLFGQYSATYTDFPKSNWFWLDFHLLRFIRTPFGFGTVFRREQETTTILKIPYGVFSRWSAAYDTYFRWESWTGILMGPIPISENRLRSFLDGLLFNQNNADTSLTIGGAAASTAESYSIKLDPPQNGHRGRTMVANPLYFRLTGRIQKY
jgi:hypothetical protein